MKIGLIDPRPERGRGSGDRKANEGMDEGMDKGGAASAGQESRGGH